MWCRSGPFPQNCTIAVIPAIFHFICKPKIDRVGRDSMYNALDKGVKNVPKATFILMAIFVCSYIKLWYTSTKCHNVLRFYLYLVLQGMGLASLPWSILSSCTVLYHLSFVETFAKSNTFDH
eukprot:g22011.t1